jgi:disulfide bond formation protein DsbB
LHCVGAVNADIGDGDGRKCTHDVDRVERFATILFWTSIGIGALSLFLNPEKTLIGGILLAIFFIACGCSIVLASVSYDKKSHKKQDYAKRYRRAGTLSDWILGKILDMTPWWLLKAFYLLVGVLFICFGIFLMTLD